MANEKDPDLAAQAKLRQSLAYQQEVRQKELIEYNEELLRSSTGLLDLKSKELEAQLSLLKAYQDEVKLFEKIMAAGDTLSDEEKKRYEERKKFNSENEKTLKDTMKLVDVSKTYSNSISNSLTSFTGIGRESNNFLGKMIQATSQGANLNLAMKDVADKFFSINGALNLLVAAMDLVVSKTIELALEQDKAFAKFEKEAGNVNLYKESIMKLRDENGKYLITVTDSTEAFSTFKKEFAGFQDLSKTNQYTLAETAAQLQKLGFNLKDLAVNQDIFIKSMGMSIEQADNFQKSLYATSLQMSLPFDKLSKDFPKASAILVARGKEMDKVFIDLQKSSKETGIQFDKLLTLASKFNTFDSAAQSAGNLNAILQGDYFNSLELINASESERIRILQERLRLNGMNINDMDQSIQLAIAQELGFSDLNDLHKAMNNEISKGTYESIKAKEAQDAMNEAIKDAAQFTEQWNVMLSNFALNMKPVLDFLKGIVSGINEIDKSVFKAVSWLVSIVGFGAAIVLAGKAIATFAAISKAASLIVGAGGLTGTLANTGPVLARWTTGVGNAATGVGKLGPAVAGAGNSAAAAWPSILAFGGAIALAGIGIAAAAYGLSYLVKAFDNTVQAGYAIGAIATIFAGFIGIIFALGKVIAVAGVEFAVAAPGLLAFGAAIALVGLGVGLAAGGFSLLVESFSGLSNSAEALEGVSKVMWGMIGAMLVFGVTAAIMGSNLAIASPGLLAFGAAFAMIGLSAGYIIASFAEMVKQTSTLFATLNNVDSENISKAMNALWDSLSGWGVVKFASFASDAETFVNALKPMTASAVALANALKEINNTTLSPKVNLDAIKAFNEGVKKIDDKAFGVLSGIPSTPTVQAPINITLEIDKNKLAEIMAGTVKFENGVIKVLNQTATKK